MQDWDALYRVAGIKSFMAVPIGGAGEVLGLLTIAKHEPGAFNDEWCVAGRQPGGQGCCSVRAGPAVLSRAVWRFLWAVMVRRADATADDSSSLHGASSAGD